MTNYSPLVIHITYIIYIKKIFYLLLYIEEEHGTFGYLWCNSSSGKSKGKWSRYRIIVNYFEMLSPF